MYTKELSLYRTLFNESRDGVYIVDAIGQIIEFNQSALDIFGYQQDEILDLRVGDFFVDEQQLAELTTHLRESGAIQDFLAQGRRKDGKIIDCLVTSTAYYEKGKLAAYLGIVRDVTEQVEARKALEASHQQLEEKAESLTIINRIAELLNQSLEFETVVNKAIQSIVDYTHAPGVAVFRVSEDADTLQMVGSHGFSDDTLAVGTILPMADSLSGITISTKRIISSDMLNADDRLEKQVKEMLIKQGLNYVISIPLLYQERAIGVINLIFIEAPHFDELIQETLLSIGKTIALAMANAGNFAQLEAQIEKRRQAESVAEEQRHLLRRVIDLNPAFIFAKDRNGRYVLANVAFADRFNKQPNDLIGKTDAELMGDGGAADQYRQHDMEVIDSGKVIAFPEAEFYFADGTSRWMQMTKLPILDADGQVTHILGISYDITERIELEEELKVSLERRSRQVRLSTQVAQEIATATSLDDLYQRVVNQVKEQFGYYHVQLLRYDPALDTVALIYGYGDIGDKMLAIHHSMPLGVGFIGMVAKTGESILRPNIAEESGWKANPLLPNTKGELAVPIKMGDRVLGVLDIQSDSLEGLSEDDQLLLEGLCGQIAIAIESTNLREEMETRLFELNMLQGQLSRDSWEQYKKYKANTKGYQFDHRGVQPLVTSPEKMASPNVKTNSNGNAKRETAVSNHKSTMTIPLTIRGQSVGEIGIQGEDDNPLSPEEQAFLYDVTEEIAEALEAARLFEETQTSLAEQERLTGEMETVAQVSMAASTILEVDSLLQSVVDLAKSSFGLYHAHVYLLDQQQGALFLKSGAGNVGRLMALEGRIIDLDASSLVALAARNRQGVLVNDVRKTVDFLPHPLLPHTQAEIAVPMIVGEKLIGVLDLQSDQVDAFTEEDLNIHRILASQIAVAVQNALQYAEQVETAVKLRELDQLKSEFLASMSHELRTPLNSIIGFADVLLEGLDGDLNERMEEDVSLIRQSGNHLRTLIGDILDMSKIEAGRMELRYEEVDMQQMAEDVIATTQPLAAEKGLKLQFEQEGNIRPLEIDKTRIRQVMLNIVGNAIKFTEKGGVTLKLSAKADHLLVSIRDTGIGIKDDQLSIVFEQFRQIDGSLNRVVGGTGLGMPISKKLVEMHGGRIWVKSVFEQGSTFYFTIPYEKPTIIENSVEETA